MYSVTDEKKYDDDNAELEFMIDGSDYDDYDDYDDGSDYDDSDVGSDSEIDEDLFI